LSLLTLALPFLIGGMGWNGTTGGVSGADNARELRRRPLQRLHEGVHGRKQRQHFPVQGRPVVRGPGEEVGVPGTRVFGVRHRRPAWLPWSV